MIEIKSNPYGQNKASQPPKGLINQTQTIVLNQESDDEWADVQKLAVLKHQAEV
jgi:hypothetical protein